MDYILLDFETTGLDPRESEIIEIGAVRVSGLGFVEKFHALVRPKTPVPAVISRLTGITNEMLATQRELAEVREEFFAFLGDLPIVAHNSSLEQSFLDTHLPRESGYQVHNSIHPLALILPDQPSLSMEALRKWAGVDSENAHRADKDCEDLLKILVHARDWMSANRPRIAGIARALLPAGWWWNWYFESPDPEIAALSPYDPGSAYSYLSRCLERPFRGDLKELRATDQAREFDEEAVVAVERVNQALKKPDAEGFQFRASQETMAQSVRDALNRQQRIAIEAPTGTGKSLAYLVPGILAAEATQTPLVVSTHSKALQDQLLEKDLPMARALLGKSEIRATSVKGQENYLCLRKLHDLINSVMAGDATDESLHERWSAAYLVAFASVNSLAELDRVSLYLKKEFPILVENSDWVRSHHTTTLGPKCPFYRSCHFYDSARLAHQADVIIANHALVFQWPLNLPQIRNVVFDEAHHLEDQITEAYSIKLTEAALAETLDRLSRARGTKRAGDATAIAKLLQKLGIGASDSETPPAVRLAELSDTIRTRMSELRSVIPLALRPQAEGSEGYEEAIELNRFRGPAREPILTALGNLAGALKDLRDYLAAALEALENQSNGSGGDLAAASGSELKPNAYKESAELHLKTHAFRFDSYEQKVRALISESEKNHLRLLHWNPRENVWRLTVAPIEVSELSKEFFESKRAIVLTSATLTFHSAFGLSPAGAGRQPNSSASGPSPAGAGRQPNSSASGPSPAGASDFVTRRIGLNLTKPLQGLPSPYDLAGRATVFVPNDIAPPGTPSHLEALIQFTEQTATLLGGRTLLLVTSNRRLKHAATILRERLQPHGIEVFDSLSDRRAADAFRTTERALLIGSERYGEGLDIPGRALSCVIVEKINESMTRGPIAEARKAKTRFALYDYDFPLRMMWLKQRVGRLIRSATDSGSVILFDPRFHTWSPASRNHVIQALAPIPVQGGSREEILQGIEQVDLRFHPQTAE